MADRWAWAVGMGLLLTGAMGAPPGAAEPRWIGYRGPEGTGVFPGSKPPVECDMKTGRNIRWRAPLPNWSHASPTIVKGRAFVMSEPGWKHDWPVLTCIDIGSGKVLWEREINHLPATGLDKAKQEEIAKKWHDFHAEWRKLYTTFAETVGQKDQDAARARFKEMGYQFKGHSGGGYGQLRSLGPKPKLAIREAGIRDDVWRHACGLGYDEIGSAFASPVTDGQHIYVVADRSAAASYDLDGNLRWMSFMPFPTELKGYNESNGRSPILYQGLMITDYPGYTVAFDKATGAVRWQVKTYGTGIATPGIVTVSAVPVGGSAGQAGAATPPTPAGYGVASVDVLLTEGQRGKGGGLYAIRLPDGKPMKLVAAKGKGVEDATEEPQPPGVDVPRKGGWGPAGNVILVNSDHRDVAYFSGGCHGGFSGAPADPETPLWTALPAAVRFALKGESLETTVLWDGRSFAGKAPSSIPMVYYRDRLYIGDVVLEALTGRVLAGGKGARAVPPTRHLLLLAHDRLYGLDGYARLCDAPPPADKPAATLTCYSLDGKPLGNSALYMAPVEGEKLAQTRSQVGWDRWGFGYGMPFSIAGDRLYLRSSDELICVGEK